MTEMLIKLSSSERDKLRKLARANGCHPRDQARLIIRSVLLGESPPDTQQKKNQQRQSYPANAAGVVG